MTVDFSARTGLTFGARQVSSSHFQNIISSNTTNIVTTHLREPDAKAIASDISQYILEIELNKNLDDCEKNKLVIQYYHQKTSTLDSGLRKQVDDILQHNNRFAYALKTQELGASFKPYIEDVNCDGKMNFDELDTQSASTGDIGAAIIKHAQQNNAQVIMLGEVHEYTLGDIPAATMEQLRAQYPHERLALGVELNPKGYPNTQSVIDAHKEHAMKADYVADKEQLINDLYFAFLKDFTLSMALDEPEKKNTYLSLDEAGQKAYLQREAQGLKQTLALIFHPDVQANPLFEMPKSIGQALSLGFDIFMFDSELVDQPDKQQEREISIAERIKTSAQDYKAVVTISGADHAKKDLVDSPQEQKNVYALLNDSKLRVASFFGAKHLDLRSRNEKVDVIKFSSFDGLFAGRSK